MLQTQYQLPQCDTKDHFNKVPSFWIMIIISMGGSASSLMHSNLSNIQARVLMIGLDNFGKISLRYQMTLGEFVTTPPTLAIANPMDFLSYNGVDLTLWDVGGQVEARQLWQHYFENSDALIFVVDSQDRARLGDARNVLESVLEDNRLTGADLLVMNNKIDLPDGVFTKELGKDLGLLERSERRWHIQACSAVTDLIFVTNLTNQVSGEKICHVEKFQLSMHDDCGEI